MSMSTGPTGPRTPSPYSPPPTSEERTWAGISHAGSFVGAAVTLAFLVPLLVRMTKGKESGFVQRHAVESLNFQISVLIYAVVSLVLVLVVVGIFMLAVLGIAYVVLVVIATIKAANGEEYRYPLTLRLFS